MTFDEWHKEYAKQYAVKTALGVPPVADMRAAWDAAVDTCKKIADESHNYQTKWSDSHACVARRISEDIAALFTAKVDAVASDK